MGNGNTITTVVRVDKIKKVEEESLDSLLDPETHLRFRLQKSSYTLVHLPMRSSIIAEEHPRRI